MLIPTNSLLMTIMGSFLDNISGGDFVGALRGSSFMLFTNNVTPTPRTLLADLTEADYTGYARVLAPTTGVVYISQDGNVAMDWGTPFFSTGSPVTVTNVITGIAVVSGDITPVLLAAERFAVAAPMQTVFDGLEWLGKIELPMPAGMGGGTVIN